MYGLPAYGRMVAEPIRFGAYRRALERAVKPGDVVIDLGAGPGVFALLAARLGARRVYAVEPDPVVELVGELARSNQLSDRIVVVPELSTGWAPELPADVIISDLRGILPTFTDHLPTLIDARRRLLCPGGTLIPARDQLWAAPVTAPLALRHHLGGFTDLEGVDLEPARRRASHLWCRVELSEQACVSAPALLASLDYASLEGSDIRATADWTLPAALIDGVAVWFDAFLDEVETFSNAPSDRHLIYGQAFFPLPESFAALGGDRLQLSFSAHHTADDYLYRWSGSFRRRGEVVARFDQSTFFGAMLSPAAIARRSPDFIPRPTPEAEIDAAILGLLDGRTSLGAAAERLLDRFPGAFTDHHAALRRVAAVSDRYGSSERLQASPDGA